MPSFVSIYARAPLLVLATAVLAAGCSSVDLGPRYNPPPVRMPQSAAPAPAVPTPLPPVATAQPVVPGQPVGQPLPPIGATTPVPAPLPQTTAPDDAANARDQLVTLTTRLEGAAVNPPTRSNATGQLDALYDARTQLLRWKASWSGLSGPITGVQFHGPAGMDQNGPAAMMWPGPFGPTYEGRATLTPQQATDLMEGRWYVNVSTTAYPGGEVRGQLLVVR